jgi:protein SCO1/2
MKRLTALTFFLLLAACGRDKTRHGVTDITGVMPDLQFAMTRANDSAFVTAKDYRGKSVLLYFGYTHCPDECPTTLANLASVLKRLGPKANGVRVLFVSVDPRRDTLPVLKSYVNVFAPQIDGLRGTDNAVASLARRYRVLYSVTPASGSRDTEVMHSDSVFVFDSNGRAREVMTSTDDAKTVAQDVAQLTR